MAGLYYTPVPPVEDTQTIIGIHIVIGLNGSLVVVCDPTRIIGWHGESH